MKSSIIHTWNSAEKWPQIKGKQFAGTRLLLIKAVGLASPLHPLQSGPAFYSRPGSSSPLYNSHWTHILRGNKSLKVIQVWRYTTFWLSVSSLGTRDVKLERREIWFLPARLQTCSSSRCGGGVCTGRVTSSSEDEPALVSSAAASASDQQ